MGSQTVTRRGRWVDVAVVAALTVAAALTPLLVKHYLLRAQPPPSAAVPPAQPVGSEPATGPATGPSTGPADQGSAPASGPSLIQVVPATGAVVLAPREFQLPPVLRPLPRVEPAVAGRQPVPTSESEFLTYTVKKGDTLTGVARKLYGVDGYARLLAADNKLKPSATLDVGTLLRARRRLSDGSGDPEFDAAMAAYHERDYDAALAQFGELAGEAADGPPQAGAPARAVLAKAMMARCHMKVGGFYDWQPEDPPEDPASGKGRHLAVARDILAGLLTAAPAHPQAKGWTRDAAGIELRLGSYGKAVRAFAAAAQQWPPLQESREDDVHWCLVAMARRLGTLSRDDRILFVHEAVKLRQVGDLFRHAEQITRGFTSAEFVDLAKLLPSDAATADAFFGTGMKELPLRARGLSDDNVEDVKRAVIWLCDMGEYRQAEALAAVIWAKPQTGRAAGPFATAYLVSLVQQGKDVEAVRVASEARLTDALWALVADVVPLRVAQALAEAPPDWLIDPELVRYAFGLRLYAAEEFDAAAAALWTLVAAGPDAPIAAYARARLCELHQLRKPDDGDWATARHRLGFAGPADGSVPPSPAFLSAVGVDGPGLRSPGLSGLRKHLLAYDAIESGLLGASPSGRSGVRSTDAFQQLIGDVVASDYFRSLPRPSQAYLAQAREALRDFKPRPGDDDDHRMLRWNRWEKWLHLETTAASEYIRQRNIVDAAAFEADVGPLNDAAWNLLRARKDDGTEDGPAARWYARGEFFVWCNPFARPGLRPAVTAAAADGWTTGLLYGPRRLDDRSEASQLRGARHRLAAYCFEKADGLAPGSARTLYNIGDARRREAELYRRDQNGWRDALLRSAVRAGLVNDPLREQLAHSASAASYRRYMPRWHLYQRRAKEAVGAYQRVAELTGSDERPAPTVLRPPGPVPTLATGRSDALRLKDDALKHAGTLTAGIGSLNDAIAFYQEGIDVGGDQRPLLELLRDGLRRRRDDEAAGGDEAMAPLVAMLLSHYQTYSPAGGEGGDGQDGRPAEPESWLPLIHERSRRSRLAAGEPTPPQWESNKLVAFVRFRLALRGRDWKQVPDLVDTIAGPRWSHPMVSYLLELWYAEARTADERTAMRDVVEAKLSRSDVGPVRFYVNLVRARLNIDLADPAKAAVALAAAKQETPFRQNAAVAYEYRRLQALAPGEHKDQAIPLDKGVQYVYVGQSLVPLTDVERQGPSGGTGPATRPSATTVPSAND